MITVIGMIYKAPTYLDFMMKGIQKLNTNYLVIANDPSTTIIDKLNADNIRHIIYRDRTPNDYYMNRIYRAWNFGGRRAEGDILIFINSDMAFSPNWLENLLAHLDRSTIPCSRLIESGKLLSGTHAISKDFGRSPDDFNETNFINYSCSIKKNEAHAGGLFMPCAFYKDDFVNSGGYPEGNIYSGGIGAFGTKFLQSGDDYFFNNNPVMKVKKHITVFSSIVYHIQEGEKDV